MLIELDPADHSCDDLDELGNSMVRESTSTGIPAGYTYLGQFIDHDLTSFSSHNHPKCTEGNTEKLSVLHNGRSPWLDLDSVYGWSTRSGIRHISGAFRNGKFRLDPAVSENGIERPGRDLPRNRKSKQAKIPDPRNDENLFVAQLHVAVMRFHNRMVDELSGSEKSKGKSLFELARQNTINAYRHIVLNDYLSRVCNPDILSILNSGQSAVDDLFRKSGISREFVGAAFRFGHVMVRASYTLRAQKSASLVDLMNLTGNGNLGGNNQMPSDSLLEWCHFFESRLPSKRVRIEKAEKISPQITAQLSKLEKDEGFNFNLAALNLKRGRQLGLPTGQALASKLQSRLAHVEELADLLKPLTAREIKERSIEPGLIHDKDFGEQTPLWYYLLCEASKYGGERLGPLGSLIVAGTIRKASTWSRGSNVIAEWRPENCEPISKHLEERRQKIQDQNRNRGGITSQDSHFSDGSPNFGAIDFIEYALGFDH